MEGKEEGQLSQRGSLFIPFRILIDLDPLLGWLVVPGNIKASLWLPYQGILVMALDTEP